MQSVVDATVSGPRLAAFLTAAFATTALALAVIGMYGVIAYLVQRRTRDIGVRIALGATSPRVLRLVVGHAMRLASLGVTMGVLASLGVGRLIRGMLFGVSANDPLTLGATMAALLSVGVVASAIPAWRATRVSPLRALAEE